MQNSTLPRHRETTAILVELPESVADFCGTVLSMLGIRVLVVGHVAAANERIPVVMPRLVIAPQTVKPEDREALSERAIAVGAELLFVAEGITDGELGPMIREAAEGALDPRKR